MTPQMVQELVEAIERKDHSTAAHTWRVVLYARALAEEMGESPEILRRVTDGAALHDVGKLGVSSAVLQKPGPLTDAERAAMQKHTVLGHELLRGLGEEDPFILDIVRHHHERWDGTGYPDRLAGEAIGVGARWFAVIDAFDAMTSIRPYRSDVGPQAAERAIRELEGGAGTRYWKPAVEGFARLYRTGRLDWVLAYFNDKDYTVPFGAAELPGAASAGGRGGQRP